VIVYFKPSLSDHAGVVNGAKRGCIL